MSTVMTSADPKTILEVKTAVAERRRLLLLLAPRLAQAEQLLLDLVQAAEASQAEAQRVYDEVAKRLGELRARRQGLFLQVGMRKTNERRGWLPVDGLPMPQVREEDIAVENVAGVPMRLVAQAPPTDDEQLAQLELEEARRALEAATRAVMHAPGERNRLRQEVATLESLNGAAEQQLARWLPQSFEERNWGADLATKMKDFTAKFGLGDGSA